MKINLYHFKTLIIFLILSLTLNLFSHCSRPNEKIKIKIGTASEEFTDSDSLKQEGKLRANAIVIEGSGTKLCMVSCDILLFRRDIIDEVGKKIETELGIPFENILIAATHTHHAPETGRLFGVTTDSEYVKRVKDAIFIAVEKADQKLKSAENAQMYFWLGQEATIGQNSRWLLSDGTIYWQGPMDDAIRPTGTFDPELPVIAFKTKDHNLEAVLFNHSTHTIGSRKKGILSPAFYGLAAQELEEEYGGKFLFFLGAHGSIHDLPFSRSTDEKIFRIKEAVKEALSKTQKKEIYRLVSVKKEFEYKAREFNEEEEEKAVTYYCRKRLQGDPEPTIEYFRNKRNEFAPHQGEIRKTWLQVMVIGDVAFVGLSGELFNDLGIEIKRRSPFRYTYIIDLANDYMGYIPDKKAFDLAGYQLWSGWSSHVAKGTGEEMVDKVVLMLTELYRER